MECINPMACVPRPAAKVRNDNDRLCKLPLKQTIDRVCTRTTNRIIQARHFCYKLRQDESEKMSEISRLTADWDAILPLVIRTTLRVANKGIQTGKHSREGQNEKTKQ